MGAFLQAGKPRAQRSRDKRVLNNAALAARISESLAALEGPRIPVAVCERVLPAWLAQEEAGWTCQGSSSLC